MKLHRTLLAIGLASLFVAGPALAVEDADDAFLDNVTSLWDITDTFGLVFIDGSVEVSARSGAVVEQTQLTGGLFSNHLTGDSNLSATMGSALDGASGNIGVNIAAGVGNAQSNDAALSSLTDDSNADATYASAMVFSDQTAYDNTAEATWFNDYDAAVTDGALAGATGNIGVNVAAGVGNAQSNALAASTNSAGTVAYATSDSNQEADGNEISLDFLPSLNLTASLDGGALNGASGNIGVNIASGVGNLQHNSLAIASASTCVTCAK
ncbi:hypothetical protein ACFQZQ_10480 [Lysobacter koreensis]|uniref:Cell surface protein n=1 Tax=Lysobacter koreensis TaxID=266122 RepID=A0ABW2YPW4_9GAMM